jgi:hypothetical protein
MEEEPKEKPKKTRTMTPEMLEKLKVARARAMEVKKELAKKNEATKINEQETKLNKRKTKLAEKEIKSGKIDLSTNEKILEAEAEDNEEEEPVTCN